MGRSPFISSPRDAHVFFPSLVTLSPWPLTGSFVTARRFGAVIEEYELREALDAVLPAKGESNHY